MGITCQVELAMEQENLVSAGGGIKGLKKALGGIKPLTEKGCLNDYEHGCGFFRHLDDILRCHYTYCMVHFFAQSPDVILRRKKYEWHPETLSVFSNWHMASFYKPFRQAKKNGFVF